MNFGCILLDGNLIEIGDDTMLGPNVQFYPPGAHDAEIGHVHKLRLRAHCIMTFFPTQVTL